MQTNQTNHIIDIIVDEKFESAKDKCEIRP